MESQVQKHKPTQQSGAIDDSFQIVFNDTPRRRRSSDCESEDSFIVFEDSPDSCYASNDVFDDSDDLNSESDSDANDEVDCANIEGIKICDSVAASDIGDTSYYKDKISQKKKSPPKRVHFSPNPPKVHVMRVWLYAAKQARCRYWQQFAIDRERFQRRIADVEKELSWVFRTQHRSRVMFLRCVQKRKDEAAKNEREAREKLEEAKRLKQKERQNVEIHKEKYETCSKIDGDKTNTDNSKPEDLDKNDSYKTTNALDNSELDSRDSLSDVTTTGDKGNGDDSGEKITDVVDCQNMGGTEKNENSTKKDQSGPLYGKEMLPYSDKKLDTEYVSCPEHVDLNS